VWAAALTRHLPWRTVPVEAMVIAAGLSILVLGAADDLRIASVLDAGGTAGDIRALGFGALGSIATNNLPTVIAALPVLHDDAQVWPLLIGANIAPTLVLTGSLSGLLWRDTARRLGLEVTGRRFSAVGLRVGLPALLVAGAIVLAVP
jgi:arsenical pump membrane protein